MAALENLREKIDNIHEQIICIRKIIESKEQDVDNLFHEEKESVLSYEEDLKKEMLGKFYETDCNNLIFISDIDGIRDDGYLFGNLLGINTNYDKEIYELFDNNFCMINILDIKNEINNDLDFIYNRIENEILKVFDYFLLSIKNHHNLIFVNNHLDNANGYDCIINEDIIKYQCGNLIRFSNLSLDPEHGIVLGSKEINRKRKIKRVKASDIDVNQVFYDFYKRSVEFCKDMINRIISENQ